MPYNYGFTNRFAPTFTPNLIPSNQNKKLFTSQPTRDTTLGPFNFNTPTIQQPIAQQAITNHPQAQIIPGVNAPVDFANQYAQIEANRPNRLAYQKLAQEGAPQIERGNWAKLGAVLAGAATGFGQNSATAGYNLGRSAYEAPQVRSDEAYDRRIKELGNLANLEDADARTKLSALEAQNRNYWDSEDLRLKNLANARADRGENRADLELSARIHQMAMDNMILINETDGYSYLYDKGTGLKRRVGKVGQNTKEQYDDAMRLFVKQKEVEAYYTKQHDDRVSATTLSANAANNAQEDAAAKDKRDLAAANIKLKALSIPPNTAASNVVHGIAAAVSRGELPEDAGNYLQFDDNGMPISKSPFWGGNIGTEDSVRQYIGSIIDNTRNPQVGGSNTGPAATDAGGPSIRPSTTGADIPSNRGTPGVLNKKYPRNPDGTVPMIGPDKVPFDADPAHVPGLLKEPGVTVGYPAGLMGNTSPAANATTSGGYVNPLDMPFTPYQWKETETEAAPTPINRAAAATGLGNTAPVNVPPAVPPVVPPPTNVQPRIPGLNFQPDTKVPSAVGNVPPLNFKPPANPIQLSQPTVAPQGVPQGLGYRDVNVPYDPYELSNTPYPRVANIPPPVVKPKVPMNPAFIRPDMDAVGGDMNFNPMKFTPPPTAPVNVPPPQTAPTVIPQGVPQSIPKGLPQTGFANRTSPPPIPAPPVNPNPIRISPPAGPASNISPAGAEMNANPDVRFNNALTSIIQSVKDQTGLNLRVVSKNRSAEEQAKLFAQGRSAKGPIVTELDGTTKKSKHQTGEAADLVFVDKNGKTVKADKKLWDVLGRAAKQYGLTWGGDWKTLYDPGHIQLGGAPNERINK